MADRGASHRCSILVVDDDAEARELLRLALSASGYDVACASDGRDALKYLRSHADTCFILLDLMLPGMNGVTFRTAQLRDRSLAWIPVVVVSGAVDAADQARAFRAHAVLRKPLDLDTVRDTLSHIGCRRTAAGGCDGPPS
jgi:two-component system, OmpR family, response regulator CpxR